MAKEDKKSAKNYNLGQILIYVVLLLIVIYLVKSSADNAKFQKEIKNTLDKTLNSVVSDFSEKEKLISANIASCGSDVSCVSLFNIKNYSCGPNLSPVCIDKFCKCN